MSAFIYVNEESCGMSSLTALSSTVSTEIRGDKGKVCGSQKLKLVKEKTTINLLMCFALVHYALFI